jgi:hypothetical protein
MPVGSLTVVGTGIRLSQLTPEAHALIQSADKVLFLVSDPVTYTWITQANATAESLHIHYSPKKLRPTSYQEMVERILSCVREGFDVCVAFYGHPGVFAYPSHEAIRRARCEGFEAKMLPGISAEDCLFADLGIDPATNGCQSFEATDFLLSQRRFDPNVALILWQIGCTGDLGYRGRCNRGGLRILIDVLGQHYDPAHEVIVYEAARYLHCEPTIQRIALGKVPQANVTLSSTLFVPARSMATPDRAMADRLGIPASFLGSAPD